MFATQVASGETLCPQHFSYFSHVLSIIINVFMLLSYQYADPVADLLDKWGTFRARLFRESCVFHRGNYVKVHYNRVLFKAHQAYRYDRVKLLVSFVPLTGFALLLEFHENFWIFEIFFQGPGKFLENSILASTPGKFLEFIY